MKKGDQRSPFTMHSSSLSYLVSLVTTRRRRDGARHRAPPSLRVPRPGLRREDERRESEPKESLQIIPCLLAVTRLFTFVPRPVYSSLFPSPLLTSSEASGTSKTRNETVRRVTRMTSDTR